jgi:hypothetical protein
MATSVERRCLAKQRRNWAVNAPVPEVRIELLCLAAEFDAEAHALDAKPSKRGKPRVTRAATASPTFPPSIW